MTREQLDRLPLDDLRAMALRQGIDPEARREELVGLLAIRLGGGASLPAQAAPRAGSASSPAGERAQPRRDGPDPGLPIPAAYQRDRLVIMAQDPWHLFAYWEITPDTLARARQDAGEAGQPVLILLGPSGEEHREVDLLGGNYYVSVTPATTYEARLALRDRHGRLHVLAGSNRVTMPAAGPSWRTDEDWMVVDERFHELVARAGLPGEAGSSANRLGGSETRLRGRSLDRRVLQWAEHDQGAGAGALPAAGPGGPSSAELAGLPSSRSLAGGPGLPSSGVLAQQILHAPSSLALSSTAPARSSRGLSSSSLSGGLGDALPAFADLPAEVQPAVAAVGHGAANAGLAAVPAGRSAAPPSPQTAATTAPSAVPPLPPPAAGGAPAAPPAAMIPGAMRGAQTVKSEGRKPLPPAARR